VDAGNHLRESRWSFDGEDGRTSVRARHPTYGEPLPLLHPGLANLYRVKVTGLAEALEQPETRSEAAEAIRGLIDAIVLTPAEGALEAFALHRASRSPAAIAARDSGLRIELTGDLAAILGTAQNTTRSSAVAPTERRRTTSWLG
jgi:hypothetical protein